MIADVEVGRQDEGAAREACGEPRQVPVRKRDRVRMHDIARARQPDEATEQFGRERACPGPKATPREQLPERGARQLHRAALHPHTAVGIFGADGNRAQAARLVPELVLRHRS